jgi:hypothetical protein
MYSSKPSIIVPGCGQDSLAIRQRILDIDKEERIISSPADHMIEELNKIYNLKINEYNRIKTNNAELPKWKNL